MAFTSIISSQTVTGESVSSDFQSIIAGSPSENTTFSGGGYQEFSATAPADDVAANLDDNYSRPAETIIHDEVTPDAGQPEYREVDSAATPDVAAALTLPSVSDNAADITTAASRRSADTGVKANVTADVAETAFAGNVNISVNDASGKSAEYKISTFGGTAPAEHAGGVGNYKISGNSTSNNLTAGSGDATFRIDDINARPIDAEKIGVVGVDSNLCWAGTDSNMLYWSGWGTDTGKLNVSIEDDMFDYFRKSFTDDGGWIEAGIEFFLDGKYSLTGQDGAAQLKQGAVGGFYPNITVSDYLKVDRSSLTIMSSLDSFLRSGDVCGLGLSWGDGSGHAITCWGFTYDTGVSKSSQNYYTGVWISDSDDNYGEGRNAPDITRYCQVTWDNSIQYYKLTYEPGVYGYLNEAVGLVSDPNTQIPKDYTVRVYSAISGETVHNGIQTVFAGGVTFNNIISSNGGQVVSSGGITSGTILSSGGSQTVSACGVANSTIANSGGSQMVTYGGVASSAIINSGGTQIVSSAGMAAGATINNGGGQLVSYGGMASSAIINSGGSQMVFAYGVANSTTISSGGQQYIASGGTASVINQQSGAAIVAYTGAKITNGTNTRSDGYSAFSIINGIASNFLLENGGLLTVSMGHSAFNTIIGSGGQQRVSSGGAANSTTVTAGGKQYISSGGATASTIINSGGKQYISSGGTANNTIVNSGGSTYVSSGGIVTGSLSVAGGDVVFENAASVSSLATLSYVLATAKTNDVLVTANSGTWNTANAVYSLNLDNTAAGSYILADGADLSGLKSKTFSVTDNGQKVNVQVGSSYTFTNSYKLSLNYTDSARDQLTAVLSAQSELTIAATDANAGEPSNNGTFRISRAGNTSNALTVYFNIDGSATDGSDYTLKNGSATLTNSVVIAAGQSSVDITLNVIDDTIIEGTENAIMSLAPNAAYTLGATTSATINISDDDDTTPPTPPSGLTGVVSGNNVALDWADSTDSGSGLKNYLLQYALNEQFTGAVQDSITASDDNVSGLADGVYYWRVQAADKSGNATAWVAGDSFTIDTTAPSVPATLTQTVTGQDVVFDWANATDATSGVKQYELQIDTSSDFNSLVNTLTPTASTINVNGLSDGSYYWRVRTLDNSDNSSDWSGALSFTVDTVAPSDPTTLSPIVVGNNVALDWTDSSDATSGLKNYLLEYALNGQFTGAVQSSVTVSNANISGLSDGIYYWRVQAADNSSNISDWVTGGSFTVDTTKPTVPSGLTEIPNGKTVNLDWTASIDATSGVKQYEIQVDSNSNFNSLEAFKRVADSQVSIDGLAAGTYYWRVRAQDNSGNFSAWSTPASFVLELTPPTVPSGLKQTVTGNSAMFNWAASTDASGIRQYQVQVDNNSDFSSPEHSAMPTANTATINDLAVGTQYWEVRSQDNAGNWSAWSNSSSFIVTPTDTAANTWQMAKDISNLDNWVGFGDPADVYKLTMTNAGTLTLGLTALSGNADLSLLSAAGAVLKSSANAGLANESINGVALLAGTYYVKVAAGVGVNDASYILTNTEKYCPTDTAANDYKTAKDINSGVDNWVGFGDAADVYKLTMTNAGTLTLGLTGLSGNADLSLLSAAGAVLKSSANAGLANESINGVALLAGTYYVKVAAGVGVNDASYTLTHTEKYCPADTAANDYKTAKDINSGVDNWVGFGDAADVYKLTMTNAGTLTLGLTGLSGNADLSLLSAAGAVLKSSANAGLANESINGVALLAGTYYVKVAAGVGVNDASYTLANQISYFPGDTYDNAGNTIAAAKLVDASLPAQPGWVGLGDSDDYYRFAVAAPTQGTLRLDMTGGNADLSLYDSNGKLLQKSAKTGTLEDVITGNLAAGTYYARVNAVSGNSIDYTLAFNKKDTAGMLAS